MPTSHFLEGRWTQPTVPFLLCFSMVTYMVECSLGETKKKKQHTKQKPK